MPKESMEKIKSKEKRMGREKKVESKEAEILPPAFIIYRDNDLFKEWIPKIAETLRGLDREVKIQGFPAGTPEEEIKKWYLAHEKELQLSDVLADDTVMRSSEFEHDPKINLDVLMEKATTEAIMGGAALAERAERVKHKAYKNPEKKQEYLSVLGEMYKRILNSIPEEKRQKLEVVILKGTSKELPLFPPLFSHEAPYCIHFYHDLRSDSKKGDFEKNFEALSKELDEFTEWMKKGFNEVGISNVTLYSTGAEIPIETVKKLTEGKAYIVFDRHTVLHLPPDIEGVSDRHTVTDVPLEYQKFWGNNLRYADVIKEKSALQLPLSTFFMNVREKIGIETDPQRIEESISKELQEKLVKEEK